MNEQCRKCKYSDMTHEDCIGRVLCRANIRLDIPCNCGHFIEMRPRKGFLDYVSPEAAAYKEFTIDKFGKVCVDPADGKDAACGIIIIDEPQYISDVHKSWVKNNLKEEKRMVGWKKRLNAEIFRLQNELNGANNLVKVIRREIVSLVENNGKLAVAKEFNIQLQDRNNDLIRENEKLVIENGKLETRIKGEENKNLVLEEDHKRHLAEKESEYFEKLNDRRIELREQLIAECIDKNISPNYKALDRRVEYILTGVDINNLDDEEKKSKG